MEFLTSGSWILPSAIFGTIMFATWAVLSMLAERQSRTVARLKRMNSGDPKGQDPLGNQKVDKVQELLEYAAPALSRPLMPKKAKEQGELKQRLSAGGFRGENAVSVYLGIKMVVTAIGLVAGASAFGYVNGLGVKMWSATAICGGIGFYLPDLIVAMKRRKHHDAIFYALPDALDLMVVCVESGLALDTAMQRVSSEMRGRAPVLSREFELANLQLQMGRQRREVLHDLGLRNGVDDLRSLAAVLIQADKFGASIGQALRVQSDSMRTRRRQQAEERAQKTAVKLLFPLILFIFPGIFVVLVGPAGITIANNLGKAMGTS